MKIGIAGYPAPPEITPDGLLEWTVNKAAELGCNIVDGDSRPVFGWDTRQYDLGYLQSLRDLADARGIEIEPYIRGPFDLAGRDSLAAIDETLLSVHAAKILGGPYVRAGYGQLNLTSSRFNPDLSKRDHLHRLINSLREAARIAADEGIIIAIENHCDFSGREIADLISAVGSSAIRAALDTGNSLTVFCDPMDDLLALAPYVVTTHMKDMQVIEAGRPGYVPFEVFGCTLGKGIVDVPKTIIELTRQGPRGRDIPFIIETGWLKLEPGIDVISEHQDVFHNSISYLRTLLNDLVGDTP